ncbi:MAG TPA: N-acetylmuramoyl-L-alanine amidase [Chthoniobacterales bacterium]|nr:N-acetylmuramoyl-L-alanine amidase [Chthoniobacterales bacterium]
MIRLRVFLGTAFIVAATLGAFVRAQSTDEQKKKKAGEEMRAVTSPTPSETPEPTAKPKPANRKSKTKKKATPTPKPKAKPTEAPEPSKTPRPKKSPSGDEEGSPTPKPKTTKSPGKQSGEDDGDTTPRPKAKPTDTPVNKKSSEAEKSATPKKKTEAEKESPTPKRTEKAEPAKTPTASASPARSQGLVETPRPATEPSAVPRPAPRPSPRPPQPQTSLPSDITVEKSGLEQEQGFEPPPPPPPVKRSWWPFSRQPSNYRYLTAANIDAIRRAPVQRSRWKFIIVHNSGTRQGSAKVFDYYHRHVRRMKNGLAYHFVIGNGTSTRNGQIEIGDRWVRQARGGHVHSDYMNNIGLGICLVGDFNRDQPTRAQLDACEELIKYLEERCGKMAVRPHREVNPPRWATDCPGDVFPYGWFARFR